jgi:hypothetical protein
MNFLIIYTKIRRLYTYSGREMEHVCLAGLLRPYFFGQHNGLYIPVKICRRTVAAAILH